MHEPFDKQCECPIDTAVVTVLRGFLVADVTLQQEIGRHWSPVALLCCYFRRRLGTLMSGADRCVVCDWSAVRKSRAIEAWSVRQAATPGDVGLRASSGQRRRELGAFIGEQKIVLRCSRRVMDVSWPNLLSRCEVTLLFESSTSIFTS